MNTTRQLIRRLSSPDVSEREVFQALNLLLRSFDTSIPRQPRVAQPVAQPRADTSKGDAEFYAEVHAALRAEGKAQNVANDLISTEAKLIAQARRLDII